MEWKHISAVPGVCGGKPCFRGTRIPVSVVLDFLGSGEPLESVLAAYPELTREHVLEAIRFAATLADFQETGISA